MVGRRLWPALLVAGAALSLGCLHDWDAYEALEGGAGSGADTSGTTSGNGELCAKMCTTYADCVANDWPACASECPDTIADCANQALDNLDTCLDDVRDVCERGK